MGQFNLLHVYIIYAYGTLLIWYIRISLVNVGCIRLCTILDILINILRFNDVSYSCRYKIWHVTKGIVYTTDIPKPHELWEVC